ncbi:MAG: prolyl oligopeptidase family serine peptidase [Verrucomicrobiales bacterium]|nr:prolyl oligopeptidase family serine peptidase [Verrucomicrobiales bacterium]
MSQYPSPVSLSPDGKRILVKTRHEKDFEISILDRVSGLVVASDRSPDTQLSLTWHPDSEAIAFQEAREGNRQYQLCVLSSRTKKRHRLNAPITRSAAPPIRWHPEGLKLAYFVTTESRSGRIVSVNTEDNGEPATILDEAALNGDFAWSPNGDELAAVSALESSRVLLVRIQPKELKAIDLPSGTIVRDLAWAPSGKTMLMTVRFPESEFFELIEVEIKTSQLIKRLSSRGDISTPLWLEPGPSFLVHLEGFGNRVPLLGSFTQELRPVLDLTNGVHQCRILADGESYNVLTKMPTSASTLLEVRLDTKKVSQIYPLPSESRAENVTPEMVFFNSVDGTSIPGILWRSTQTKEKLKGVLIDVHGGPRLQATTEQNPAKQWLLSNGIHIMSVNYRGSAGYGRAFEEADAETNQIDDIVAACRYATDTLPGAGRHIVLLGSSHGSKLVLGASKRWSGPLTGIVITSFSSAPDDAISQWSDHRFYIYGFHGQHDSITAPSLARAGLERYLGRECFSPTNGNWEVLPGEGHQFHRTISWAKVYTSVLLLLDLNRTGLDSM